MANLFRPPSAPRTIGYTRFLRRFVYPEGISVVRVTGNLQTLVYPDENILSGLKEGVDYFLGGHDYYNVPDAVAAELVAAGFTMYGDGFPLPIPTDPGTGTNTGGPGTGGGGGGGGGGTGNPDTPPDITDPDGFGLGGFGSGAFGDQAGSPQDDRFGDGAFGDGPFGN